MPAARQGRCEGRKPVPAGWMLSPTYGGGSIEPTRNAGRRRANSPGCSLTRAPHRRSRPDPDDGGAGGDDFVEAVIDVAVWLDLRRAAGFIRDGVRLSVVSQQNCAPLVVCWAADGLRYCLRQ